MPRNGSGVYSLPAGTIVANGQALDESQHNPAMLDIAAEFNAARPIVAGGTGATSASGARTALGLAIGSDVQAHDATLTSLAALGTAPGKIAYTTGVDTWAETPITAAGRALLDDADAAAQRATLGLGAVTATTSPVADLNAITVSGWASFALGAANAPMADNSGYVLTITSGSVGVQMAWGHLGSADDTFSWMRWRGSSGWRPWVKLRTLNASGDAPTYACRAWVNFDGTGTVAIRAAGNVSSITDNGVGDYTINFDTAMPDTNYAVVGQADGGNSSYVSSLKASSRGLNNVRIVTSETDAGLTRYFDANPINVAIFR